MSIFKETRFGRAIAVSTGLVTALFLLGAVAIPASAQTVGELEAKINEMMAQLAALKGTPATTVGSYTFTQTLKLGSRGAEVKNLQKVLNSNVATQIASTGAGSPGSETEYFGALTKVAVVKFQELYASDILTPNGLTKGTGLVGPSTMRKLNTMSSAGGTTTTGGTTTGGTTTGGTTTGGATTASGALTVEAGVQPLASLAPGNLTAQAARVPFTVIKLTAGASDATINGVKVRRTGLASDAAFSGVVLLDENGLQLGIAKTFNSAHEATVGEAMTIKAGTTRTLTIAGNMADAATGGYAGQVASISVIGVDSTTAPGGTFPIVGAAHTINSTVTIGSVTLARGPLDPGASSGNGTVKEIGSTGYTFSSIKVTAQSAEKVYLKSVRWNQTGSAGSTDLSNLKSYVDGTAYDMTVSADGKYYTASFGNPGLLIDKGMSKEIAVKGDIMGGSGRTVDFDIAKRTDLYMQGETYGYGITAPAGSSVPTADGAAFSSGEDPFYDAGQVEISAGSVNVSASSVVASQNIPINVADKPLGAWTVEVRGEPVTVSRLPFNFLLTDSSGSSLGLNDLTNVSLVNQNGVSVAGPSDPSATTLYGTLTFTDSLTFPVGTTVLTLKGKLGTDFGQNDTIVASTSPSAWTSVIGQTTGKSISAKPTSGAVTGPTMTVKAGALTVSVGTQPSARTVVAGANAYTFATYVLDATASGEDVKLLNMPLTYTPGAATAVASNYLSNCQLYDGATSVTTGSNVDGGLSAYAATQPSYPSFTFDGNGLTVQKGMTKTLTLACSISKSATGDYKWGISTDAVRSSTWSGVTGLDSGQTVTPAITTNTGNAMTMATGGTYTMTSDDTLVYKVAQAGTTDVELAKFRMTAGANEELDLKQMTFQLGSTASNSPDDLVGSQITIWDGTTKLGTAIFTPGDYATSTLTTALRVARGATKTITVKGSLTSHGINLGTPGAFLVVNYDGDTGTQGTYALGVDSGTNIPPSSNADITTSGMRIFRSVPTVASANTSSSLGAGGTGKTIYRFGITAGSGGDIGLYKLAFKFATSGPANFKVTNFDLTDETSGVNVNSAQLSAANVYATGAVLDTVSVLFNNSSDTRGRVVAAGTTRYYVLKGDIAGLDPTSAKSTISTALIQDDQFPTLGNNYLMLTATGLQSLSPATTTGAMMIWSPFSTTSSTGASTANANLDWTNGYGVAGFPGLGQDLASATYSD